MKGSEAGDGAGDVAFWQNKAGVRRRGSFLKIREAYLSGLNTAAQGTTPVSPAARRTGDKFSQGIGHF